MNILQKANRLFEEAARAWEQGNNGLGADGKPVATNAKGRNLSKQDALCNRLRLQAEALIRPLGIEVRDYPGLYPLFTAKGREYHTLGEAFQAAVS